MGSNTTIDASREIRSGRPLASDIPRRVGQRVLLNPILPLLLVTIPLFVVFVPDYATTVNFQNLLLQGAVLLLLVGGGALVVISGNFDLSTEGTLAFTAVLGAWMLTAKANAGSGWDLPPVLIIPMMITVGALIGALNGVLVQKLGVNPFIVTLGTLLALKGAAAIPTHAQTIYNLPSQYTRIGTVSIFGVSGIVVLSVVVYVLLALYVRHSRFGRHLYAVGGSRIAAEENGISPLRIVIAAYAISGALAGVAGWMASARLDSAGALLGDGTIFTVFAALVIGGLSLSGGRGNLWGAAGGVFLLSSVENVLNLIALNALYVNFVRGMVIVVAVLLIVVRQRIATKLGLQEPAS